MPNINKNFINDYSRLKTVNAQFTVKNRYTNTEKLSVNHGTIFLNPAGTIIVDGFTGRLGELLFQANFENSDPFISDSNYFFDFGDGTTGTGLSTFHIYDTPGKYNITLVVTDSAGNFFKSVQEKQLEIIDSIQDLIYLTFSELSTQKTSIPETTILVTRYNSVNSTRLLSSTNFSINISVSGQANKFYNKNNYLNDNSFQYKKGSYLIKGIGDEFEVIDSVNTTSDNIYATYTLFNSAMQLKYTPVKVDNSFFIGSSGFAFFKYLED
jgi:PKD repeat protein